MARRTRRAGRLTRWLQPRSALGAYEDDFDCNALPLWPERSLATVGVKSESASRINRVKTEDAFIFCAGNKADLATLAVHETNNCSARARRPSRARWPFRTWRPLIAPLALKGYLVFSASRERQHQEKCGKA